MSKTDSAAANYALVQEAAAQAQDGEQRRQRRAIWADELKQAALEVKKAAHLRQQIDQTKANGRDDNGDRLRELGAEHHGLTGAGGRAI